MKPYSVRMTDVNGTYRCSRALAWVEAIAYFIALAANDLVTSGPLTVHPKKNSKHHAM
jgi:hypothetical protein